MLASPKVKQTADGNPMASLVHWGTELRQETSREWSALFHEFSVELKLLVPLAKNSLTDGLSWRYTEVQDHTVLMCTTPAAGNDRLP